MMIQGSARRILFALSFVVTLFAGSRLLAIPVQLPSIYIGYLDANSQYHALSFDASTMGSYVANSDGSHEWSMTGANYYEIPGFLTHMQWDLTLDADPIVSGFVGLTNSSGFTNTYTVTVTQPISPALPTSVMNGSTAWTLTQSNSTSHIATLNSPDALYAAQVDGGTVRTLFPGSVPPLALTTTTSTSINTSFSGEATPVAANSTIGIYNHFTLSEGDSASATSVFQIVPTVAPEPASITLSLLGFAGVAMMFRKRR